MVSFPFPVLGTWGDFSHFHCKHFVGLLQAKLIKAGPPSPRPCRIIPLDSLPLRLVHTEPLTVCQLLFRFLKLALVPVQVSALGGSDSVFLPVSNFWHPGLLCDLISVIDLKSFINFSVFSFYLCKFLTCWTRNQQSTCYRFFKSSYLENIPCIVSPS